MTTTLDERIWTREDFEAFKARPENRSKVWELIHGVPFEKYGYVGEGEELPGPTLLHGEVVGGFVTFLRLFVKPRRLGFVVQEVYEFELAPGITVKPDVAFIRPGRAAYSTYLFTFAPDIAVEVVSPSNTAAQVTRKVGDYLAYGSQLVWVAYPEERVVVVYAPNRAPVTLREGDTLDGGDVLPGFSVPVADLFPPIEFDQEQA